MHFTKVMWRMWEKMKGVHSPGRGCFLGAALCQGDLCRLMERDPWIDGTDSPMAMFTSLLHF